MPAAQISTFDQLKNFINENLPDNISGLIDPLDIRTSLLKLIDTQELNNAILYANFSPEQTEVWNNLIEKLEQIQRDNLSGIKGVATQSNAPTPDVEFERWIITSPITAPNSWGNITVTQEEIDDNNVYFNVTDGVVSKELNKKAVLGLSQEIETERTDLATSEKAVSDFVDDKLFVEGKNLFDFTKISDGRYIDPATGELADSPPFFASDFIAVQGSENYIVSPNFTFICFYDVNKIFISGIGLANQTVIATPSNAKYLRFSQNSYPITAEFFQLEKGTVATTYEPYKGRIARFLENKGSVEINKITAVKNPGNYNSVRNLVAGITDASEYNQYEIFVPAGTWNELDWSGKKWVKIFGDISGKTIINLDPLGVMASNVVPAGFPFPSEIGKTLSSTVQYARHIIFVQDDIHCENLTFKAKDSKYAIHIDDKKYKKAYFKNCHIIDDNCNYPVGMGINGGQEVTFESCVLKSLNINKFGFFYHNWNNQTEGNVVTFNRCKFDNCRYGFIDELGSEQTDFINVTNCFSTLGEVGQWLNFLVDITGDGKTYWVNPATGLKEPNPVNVPYCIVVNTSGTKINQLTANDSANFNPAWSGIPQRDIAKIEEMSVIEK